MNFKTHAYNFEKKNYFYTVTVEIIIEFIGKMQRMILINEAL